MTMIMEYIDQWTNMSSVILLGTISFNPYLVRNLSPLDRRVT
jgi:hypothetical protein